MAEMLECQLCHTSCELMYQNLADDRYGYPGSFSVYQCPHCQLGTLAPQLNDKQISQLYTDYYPRRAISATAIQRAAAYRPTLGFKISSWLKGTNNLSHYYIAPHTTVLDVGCGDGSSLLEIQAQGANAYGTEYDQNVAPAAKQLGLTIHFGPLDTAPYPDHQFDYITMNQLIEHINDPVQFLQQAAKKLKPSGALILSTPNLNGLNRRWSQRHWINWHVPFHMNFFTHKSLALLATQAGFTIQRLKTITPATWVTLQCLNRYGKISPWTSKPTELTFLQYFTQLGFIQSIWLITAHLFGYCSIPIMRLIDACGLGDSFLIILKKKTL